LPTTAHSCHNATHEFRFHFFPQAVPEAGPKTDTAGSLTLDTPLSFRFRADRMHAFPMTSHRANLCAGLLVALGLLCGCKDKEEIKVYRVSKAEPAPPALKNPGPVDMAGMPPMGAPMAAGGPSAQPSQVTGNPPAHWEVQPLSAMRQASYIVKGDNGATADISLVSLAGPAGGALDNVNRWLGQLGQPSVTAEQLAQMSQHVSSPLGDVTVIDIEGLPQGADPAKDGRIIAGIAAGDSGTFFFKMRGNAGLTASQKAAFLQWIGTVRMAGAQPTHP
jgi:hypothetical protein